MAPRTTSRGALGPPPARARTLPRGGCEGAARRPIAECPRIPRGRARGARLPRASPRSDDASNRRGPRIRQIPRRMYTRVCIYTFLHFSSNRKVSRSRGGRVSIRKRPSTWSTRLIRRSAFMGTEGDAMERPKRGKETAVVNRNLQERLVRGLNLNLANMTSLATAYKQAHWNLQGPGFAQLHELFDRFADQTREYADLVAERAVQLHGTSHGTIEGAVKETTLSPFPLDEHRQDVLLAALVERASAAIAEIRGGIDASERSEEHTSELQSPE